MERLTEYVLDGVAAPVYKLFEECKVIGDKNGYNRMINKLSKQLAAYEDVGLTPEEIQNDIRVFTDMWEQKVADLKARLNYQEALTDSWERNAQSGRELAHKYRELLLKAREELQAYKDAEEQGLLVKLPPCKIGEILYCIDDGEIYAYYIDNVAYMGNGKFMIAYNEYTLDDFGVMAFASREAAEEALKGARINANM